MKLLVIGGSGHVGTLVLPHLAVKHSVRVFDLKRPAMDTVEYVQGNVCEPDDLNGVWDGIDALVYMAMGSHTAVNGDHWATMQAHTNAFDVNIKGVYVALHAARKAGVTHAVYTSSMSVYKDNGVNRAGSDEDTPPDADHVYGLTKRMGEEVCRAACRRWGMSVNALRLCLPVSEEVWMAQVKLGEPSIMTTAGDTASAILRALEYRDGFQAFTVSGDYEHRLLSMAKAQTLLQWAPLARPMLTE